MKNRDLAIIIVVAFLSALVSFGISKLIFSGQKSHSLKAPKVDQITADFKAPDGKYFNRLSLDITKVIVIGDSTNPNPLKSNSQ